MTRDGGTDVKARDVCGSIEGKRPSKLVTGVHGAVEVFEIKLKAGFWVVRLKGHGHGQNDVTSMQILSLYQLATVGDGRARGGVDDDVWGFLGEKRDEKMTERVFDELALCECGRGAEQSQRRFSDSVQLQFDQRHFFLLLAVRGSQKNIDLSGTCPDVREGELLEQLGREILENDD